jgi:hypothetical protein
VSSNRSRALLAYLLVSLAHASMSQAQVCFRGHPQDRCSGFMVLEFTAAAQLQQEPAPGGDPGRIYLSWEAGYLQNLGTRSALGGAFRVAVDDDGHRYGAVLRYRQWLGPSWSLDLSPGLLAGGSMNFTTLSFPSATAAVAVNWADRVAFTLGADQLRRSDGTHWAPYAGLRFGTWWAPVVTMGLIALAAATYD